MFSKTIIRNLCKYLPTTYVVWGKIMSLQASVILSTGEGGWGGGGRCLVRGGDVGAWTEGGGSCLVGRDMWLIRGVGRCLVRGSDHPSPSDQRHHSFWPDTLPWPDTTHPPPPRICQDMVNRQSVHHPTGIHSCYLSKLDGVKITCGDHPDGVVVSVIVSQEFQTFVVLHN